jgi:alanine racemase
MAATAGLTSWIEVSSTALEHNLALFRQVLSPGTALLAVVKANAYGHGLEQVVSVCRGAGVEWFGVHAADEIAALRRCGHAGPVLAMGYLTPAQVEAVVDPEVHVLLSSAEVLEAVAAHSRRLGAPLSVHVKVDTGTHRQGVAPAEAVELMVRARAAGLAVVGVATHFANIEDTNDREYPRRQLRVFRETLAAARERVGEVRWVHAANSAAALLYPEAGFTMARVGVSLYGHFSANETRLSWRTEHGDGAQGPLPVLSWRARLGQVKAVPEGAAVGYGLTYRTTRPSLLAVLPVGYSDGYPRALSNRARVLVRGRRAPVAGRVAMNLTTIDVTDVPGVREGDVATLIGADGGERLAAEELAELAGTINYEILARLSAGIVRLLV